MSFFRLDKKALYNVVPYITQSLKAFVAMLAILFFLDIFVEVSIIAALGSSVFVVFAMPKAHTARPRAVIGGHVVGIICGMLCSLVVLPLLEKVLPYQEAALMLSAALAVALSIFLMCVTNTEHAPASGTALGLVVHFWDQTTIIFILFSVVLLSIIKLVLKNKLKDLV